ETYRAALDVIPAGDSHSRAACLAGMGRLEKDLRHDNNARKHLLEALDIVKRRNDLGGATYISAQIAHHYYLVGDFKTSLDFSLQSFNYANEHGGLQNIQNTAEDVSRACERLGRYKEALKYAHIAKSIHDSIDKGASLKHLDLLEAEFEHERQHMLQAQDHLQNEIDFELRASKQHLIRMVMTGGLIGLFFIALLVLRQSFQRRKSNESLKNEIAERERSEEELNTFVYKSSHELKGPLASIEGLLRLIDKEKLPTDSARYVDMIASKTDQLNLILARLMQGVEILDTQYRPEELDVEAVWQQALQRLENRPGYENVAFSMQKGNAPLYMDARITTLVLESLLANGIDFQALDGRPVKVEADFAREGNIQVLTVRDNGVGMSPEIAFPRKIGFYFHRTAVQSLKINAVGEEAFQDQGR
ncbi:MAG: HAMP domain-containing sensor histidine kinase, partial [Bacteroidota bacterium]